MERYLVKNAGSYGYECNFRNIFTTWLQKWLERFVIEPIIVQLLCKPGEGEKKLIV